MTPTADGQWQPYLKIPMEDTLTTTPIRFDKSGKLLYLTDSRGRNTSALFTLNMEMGEQTLIAEDPRADFSDYVLHPVEKTIQAAAFTYERTSWQIIDPAVADDLAYLSSVEDGELEVTSHTLDDKRWIVTYVMDNGGPSICGE